MKEFTVLKNDANQRFDKYLKKLLPEASMGFIYKMLRKKNITLNGKKADGTESLSINDSVKLFLSDETFDKFSGSTAAEKDIYDFYKSLILPALDIIFENEDIILLNKPSNMLSQKANEQDISANELLIAYLIQKGELSKEEFRTFHPSVCNRLDRNTTGILVFGKTLKGLQDMSNALKDRSAHKFYLAVVEGKTEPTFELKGFLTKDESNNTVSLSRNPSTGALFVHTKFKSLSYKSETNLSLLEIELITGKTHQIRAHLASVNHAIIGDYKYGRRPVNDRFKKEFGVTSQLLHAKRLQLPEYGTYTAEEPSIFHILME